MSKQDTPISATVGGRKQDFPKHSVVWLILALQLLPLYMMVQISVKNNTEFLTNPWFPTDPMQWNWHNFVYGIKLIGPYLANTVFVATLGAFFTLFFAIMASYFFARYRMPGHNLLWSLFITLMLLPGVANIVPLFSLLKSMNLLNTLWALIILGFAGGQVFNTFILRNFIEDLPKDLFEAAEIDGASHWQQIINVVLPLSAPIIGTLFILSFLHLWNEFMMPLIILSDKELFTLGVGLIYLDGEYVKQWGQIMAAFLVASVPLIMIFLFCMKLFVRGLTSGAVKG